MITTHKIEIYLSCCPMLSVKCPFLYVVLMWFSCPFDSCGCCSLGKNAKKVQSVQIIFIFLCAKSH